MKINYEKAIQESRQNLADLEAKFRKEYGYRSEGEDNEFGLSPNVYIHRTDHDDLILYGNLYKSDLSKLIDILTRYHEDNEYDQ